MHTLNFCSFFYSEQYKCNLKDEYTKYIIYFCKNVYKITNFTIVV